MDAALLARIQFGVTAGFHFIFPQLTIGMSWVIFAMMLRWFRTGEDRYRRMALFWTGIFAVGFAVGVATGIVLEFQFGTNWAAYSRYVGDIFGSPLAAEGVFAFFLESTFLGLLLFGWKKLSPKMMMISSLMVAIGSTLSAFWIIVANSWQQTPVGYHIVGGRAEMTSFFDVVFNPSTIIRLLHTVDGALIAGAFMVNALSAWFLLQRRHVKFAVDSMRFALVLGLVASGAQFFIGHSHAVQVYKTQPVKLAAIEGHFKTESHAALLVFGIPDAAAGVTHFEIPLPDMLSYGVSGDANTVIEGLNDVPRDLWPPLYLTFFPFHIMVALWLLLMLVTIWGVVLLWQNKLQDVRLYQYLALWSVPAPILSSTLGWMTAEIGRQPWAVYGLLKTADAVSPVVSAAEVAFSLSLLSLIYIGLFCVWFFLIRKKLHEGPEEEAQAAEQGATA